MTDLTFPAGYKEVHNEIGDTLFKVFSERGEPCEPFIVLALVNHLTRVLISRQIRDDTKEEDIKKAVEQWVRVAIHHAVDEQLPRLLED
jgi:hypothetical protein